MRFLQILALCLSILIYSVPVYALDDTRAFSGLTSVRAVYDVRTSDEKKLQFILTVIRDTLNETVQQDVKPRYIASMRGPTVKLLIRNRQGDQELQKKTVELIDELNKRGVRMEACGYALNLFGLEPEDLYEGVHAIGNSLNSLIGYQTQGYALVPMN
jgi:intracellular sulfur oxidation DsrE/DsrF family protein